MRLKWIPTAVLLLAVLSSHTDALGEEVPSAAARLVHGARADAEPTATWPEFRGPDAQGHSLAQGLPRSWGEEQNVAWKVPIEGRGWSSPIVVGDRIWVTTAVESKLSPEEAQSRIEQAAGPKGGRDVSGPTTMRVLCLARDDGRVLYDRELFVIDEPDPIHSLNSYASPTPVYDDGKVYCHFGTYGTACIDAESGKVLWQRRFPLVHIVGPGSSPTVYRDLLIIPCDGADQQYILALNKQTGETVWKTDRPPIDNPDGDMRKSFCTPLVIEHNGRTQVIVPGSQWFVSYDPDSGEELWRVKHGGGFSVVPRPVFGDGIVYVCSGYNKASLWAIRVDGKGDVTESHVAWTSDKQIPFRSSPLLLDGLLYVISDNGVGTCFDARTGRVFWTRRMAGNYSSSPLHADGHIFFFSQEGKATVVKPGRRYDEVAVNQLESGFMASAAALDRALFLRTEKHLYRIEEQAQAGR